MKVVFMGTPEFACPALTALCTSQHEVVAVVTGVDQRAPRGKLMAPTAVCVEAGHSGTEVIKVATLRDLALADRVRALAPDLIVVVAFKILPESLYSIPAKGAMNIHASLLPKYRGAAPINWALINGEKETGLSSFFLKKKVDTGDVICQRKLAIADDDNFDTLHAKLSALSGPFLLETIDLIERGENCPVGQEDNLATPAPKITPELTRIHFDQPAEKVRNFVRGLSSRPGAYTVFRGIKVKLFECRTTTDTDLGATAPGTATIDHKRLLVQCADRPVELLDLLPQGKKRMDAGSFLNGFRGKDGEKFGQDDQTNKEKV